MIDVITSYYSANKYIIEISIEAKNGKISYGQDSSAEPPATEKKIRGISENNTGQAYWIGSGREDSSTLCVRTIKKIENLSLVKLGLMYIRFDFSRLMERTQKEMSTEETLLYVWNGDGAVYPAGENDPQLKEMLTNIHPYEILSVDGRKEFAVSSRIQDPDWTFLSLTGYNEAFHSAVFANILFLLLNFAVIVLAVVVSNTLIRNIMVHFSTLMDKINGFRSVPAPGKGGYDYASRHDELGVLHQQFDGMVQRINQLIEDNYVKQLLIKDTQMKMLEQQINPHFLFNTLESINWQAKANRQEQISLITEALGSLLRYTVGEKADVVPVSRELSIVENYMAIQQIRFDDRLRFLSRPDPDLLGVLIPKMSVQPLVENAIKYSLEKSTEVCAIEVMVRRKGEAAEICVRNTGSRIDPDILEKLEKKEVLPSGCGIGLVNISKRLGILFGPEFGLSFHNRDGCALAAFTVHLTFPKEGTKESC